MVDCAGRVTDASQPDVAALLRDILQQQIAMLQVQVESVRLQRVLVERLLGAPGPRHDAAEPAAIAPTTTTSNMPADLPTGSLPPAAPVGTARLAVSEAAPNEAISKQTPPPVEVE